MLIQRSVNIGFTNLQFTTPLIFLFPQIMKAVLLQCKKKDLQYKAVAVEVTGKVAGALNVDCFSDLYEVAVSVLRPSETGEDERRGASEDEREEARLKRAAMLELQIKSIKALGEAWPDSELGQGTVHVHLHTCTYTHTFMHMYVLLCAAII